MKSALKMVLDGPLEYQALAVMCPGCQEFGGSGLHMLPIGGDTGDKPRWEWNGQKDIPTLTPSVRTRSRSSREEICHGFIIDGSWRYLEDSTHSLSGQVVDLPELPDWVTNT